MSTYTIGEVAERTGFATSTLRYYEEIGLLAAPARTDAGHRLYDDGTLERLGFISRAKRLGCTLDEIGDLVRLRDGESCGRVQRRLHQLVTGKIQATRGRMLELSSLAVQLHAAAARLGGPATDGPCEEGCACASDPSAGSSPPVVCNLEPGAVPGRLAEWDTVLAGARAREVTADGAVRLELGDGADLASLAELVSQERRCCAFLAFAITVDDRGVALEVRAPEEASGMVDAIFGVAA